MTMVLRNKCDATVYKSDVFKDSQYASRTFKDKMLVAKRLYAQEKREGRAADRNQAEREGAQARSTERMAA
eukprot:COSAG01_NODE_42013_length_444_cov_2.281159_1_plen_70_part_10